VRVRLRHHFQQLHDRLMSAGSGLHGHPGQAVTPPNDGESEGFLLGVLGLIGVLGNVVQPMRFLYLKKGWRPTDGVVHNVVSVIRQSVLRERNGAG
jgi:hypothetical protein